MSTKTLRKRIALVAVTALGAGLLSVAPANATVTANTLVAATVIAGGSNNAAAGAGNATSTDDGVLNIATASSADGTTSSGTKSIGLVNVSDIAGGLVAGTTQTAVLLSSGTLSVYTDAPATVTQMITVDGGTISGTYTAAAFKSTATAAAQTAGGVLNAAIKPNSGATSMTVRLYATNGESTSGTPWTAAELLTGATSGILVGQIVVSIAAASTAGTFAAGKSGAYFIATSGSSADVTSDGANAGKTDFSRSVYLAVRARDAYGVAIDGPGLLTVAATGGAYVGINADGVAGNAYLALTSAQTPDLQKIYVSNPTSKPMASTVTVSFNGTTIGSRTVGFSGEVAKVVLSGAAIGKTTGTANYVKYKLYDAAGNDVYTKYTGVGTNQATPVSGLSGDSTVLTTVVTAISQDSDNESEINPSTGVTSSGYLDFACGPIAGAGNVAAVYTNVSGSVIKSNVLPVSCAGDAVSYKASYDKATYKPGDIATLTVQFYDSKGNKANDITAVEVGTHTVSTAGVTVIAGPSTVSGYDSTNLLGDGAIAYTYSVGTATGTFTNKIDFPTVNTAGAALLTTATTATLTIADGGVGLADVLKAIVSLIASINKQIAALQKALLKK